MSEKKIVDGISMIFRPTRSESPPKNQMAKAVTMPSIDVSAPA